MRDDTGQFGAGIYGLAEARPDPGGIDRGREPLELLASEFVEGLRCGRSPDVADYARRHPELADAIREMFPLLAAMEEWKKHRERTSFEHRSLETLAHEQFGNFQIVREVGRGGMGVVFEAHEQLTGRRVAIKVIPYLQSARMRASFEREAQTAARLRHPHIVPVYTHGEHDGLGFYIMRLIEGVGLDWVIRQLSGREGIVLPHQIAHQFAASAENRAAGVGPAGNKPDTNRPVPGVTRGASTSDYPVVHESPAFVSGLRRDSWLEMARIAAQAAHALYYAHTRGTLHRDIKPGNLLLDRNGRIWITDFGLAHDPRDVPYPTGRETGGPACDPSLAAGTLRYIAPEQFDGRIDGRSDIYAFGVTLYEFVTRTPAFDAPDRKSLIAAITQSSLRRPRDYNATIPRDLEAIVLKASAKEPASRYQSAAELWADLMCFIKGQHVEARRRFRWIAFRPCHWHRWR